MRMGKLRKTGVVWLLLAALVILPHFCVWAGQELGSIQVTLPAEGAGAELTLYRVADINGTEYFYEPGSPFAGSGVSLSGLDTAEKVVQAAEQLAAYAAQQGITGIPQRPQRSGEAFEVYWGDLAPGAYLIVQTGGQDQIDIQKTLVSVPSVINDEVVYNVQVEAKYTIPEGAVILNKTDDAENPVPGAEFLLQMKTYVTEDGTLPDGMETGSDSGGRYYWQTLGTYTTDENGQIAVEHLRLGLYRFMEQSVPEGYVGTTLPFYFSLEAPGTLAEENGRYVPGDRNVPVVSVVNPRTHVEINKVDEEGNGLAGATLVICDSEGNIILDENGNPRWQFVTDGEPYEIYGIPAGSYLLRELEAPEGYHLAEDVPFVVTGDTDETVVVTMEDELEGAVILNKTDEDRNPLEGVEYALQKKTYGTGPAGAETGSDGGGDFYWETLGTYATDANGQIAVEHLVVGDYRFVEQSAPEGYILSTVPLEFTISGQGTVAVEDGRYVPGSGTVPQVSAVNRRTRVQINKVDENGNGVASATLVICDSEGNVIVDENGNPRWQFVTDGEPYEILGMPAGNYILRELEAPEGYILAEDVPFTVTGDTDEAVVVTMVDEAEGAVILNKVDEDGNPVPGAVYELQRKVYGAAGEAPDGAETGNDSEGTFYWETLGTYTTDVNGQIAVEHLELGDYRFVEQSAPEGYILSTEPLEFTIAGPGTLAVENGRYVPGSGTVPQVSAVNRRTRVQINKVDENGNGVAGATLVICDSEGNVIVDENGNPRWQFVTDGEPYEILGMPAGNYILRELEAPEGYILAEDVPFVVTGDTDEAVVVTMVDEAEGAVILNKVDEDGNPVPGAVYELQRKVYGTAGEAPDGAETGSDSEGSFYWETVGTYTTDVNGQIAVEHLELGDYRFVEQSAPEGYILSTEPLNFTIAGPGTVAVENGRYVPGSGTVPELTAVNLRTRVIIEKVDEEGNGVAGATLVICDSEGNIILDENGNPRWQFVTNGEPYEILGMPAGNYILRELEAPEGYRLAADVPFTVTGDTDEAVVVTMVDEVEGAVILNKVDENGNPVPGAVYELQKKTYGAAPDGAESGSDSEGSFYWETVGTYTTDANGQIAVEHLELGDYRFVEQSAPEGYILSTEPLEFTIAGPGTLAVENGRYVPGSGTVPVLTAVNRRTRVEVDKVDEEGNGVAGAVLVICDSEGNVILDEDGNPRWLFLTDGQPQEVRGIPAGSYILRELTAPEGYELAADVPFTVTGDTDELITVTMVDEREEPEEGELSVTKYLRTLAGEDLTAVEGTFYVALFADAARTERVSNVIPVEFSGSSSQTVTFTGLPLDTVYYVSETDALGNPIDDGTYGEGGIFAALFADGSQAELTAEVPEGAIEFENVFSEVPEEFYYEGTLTVTKRVLRNGRMVNSNETFYAGIFEDPDYKTLYGDVIELKMDGSSELSVEIPVTLGQNVGDSKTYYVTETDADGVPVAGAAGFKYEVSVDKTSVTMSGEHDEETVVITNEKTTEPDEGELSVTKNLRRFSGEALKTPDGTFYVALFADEARTRRVSDVMPMRFVNASSQTVTFEGLPLGTEYYVSETDEKGNPIDSGTIGEEGEFSAVFPDGNRKKLTVKAPEKAVTFENVFRDTPPEYYVEGELTITKRVFRNGALSGTGETFYAGIFEDPEYKTQYGDVIELVMDGNSELSVTVPVYIGQNPDDSKTYYVTETDADGVPVAGSASFAYTVSVDKTSVTLSGDHSEEAVVITNARTEPPGEPVIPETPDNPESPENPDTPPTQNSVKTGDETPVGLYLGIFAGSAVVIVGLLVFFIRRRKKTR